MIYKTQKRNTPVATLIKNYVNKKSGKVVVSRNELQKRFEHLDWKDQKKILMAHLDSCRADRLWAYKNLTRYWDKSFESKVKDVWEKLHEPICSWAIIRHFPISYIKENLELFTGERNFYFISHRFAEDPNYVIERDKLSSINYLSIIYHSGRTISDEEAEDILYKIVHEMCVKGFGFEDLENVDFPDGIVSLNNLRSIRLGKYYLREMGFINTVISFDNWNQKVLHNIFQSYEFKEIMKESDDLFICARKIDIARKYAYLTLDNKYKSPKDAIMIKLLASNESKRYESQELITSRITNFFTPSDPQYLEELKQNNPIVRRLLDKLSLELEV